MNYLILGLVVLVAGCGSNKKYLQEARDFADKVIVMDCNEVKTYATIIRDRLNQELAK